MYKGNDAYEEWRALVWNKYKHNENETPEDVLNRTAEVYYPPMKDVFFDENGNLTYRVFPGGRVMYAAGKEGASPYNCSVIPSPDDSMEGIFDTAKRMALAFKSGLGVGLDISTLRPEGASVKRGSAGSSTGAWSWAELYSTVTGLVGQSNRRGALLLSIDISHPDILKFVKMKHDLNQENINFIAQLGITEDHPFYEQAKYLLSRHQVRYANISVRVTDEFMCAVEDDKDWELYYEVKHDDGTTEVISQAVKARDLWNQIIENMYESSEPGFLFIDRIQENYILHEYEPIVTTNPCVTADTWVMTSEGARFVKDLINKPCDVLVNGKPYRSEKGFFHTGIKKVYRIRTKEGFEIKATSDHPFMKASYPENKWVELRDLQVGDRILLNNHRSFDYGDIDLSDFDEGYRLAGYDDIDEKIQEYESLSYSFQLGFLRSLFDQFGRASIIPDGVIISLTSGFSFTTFQSIQRMLLRFGIMSEIQKVMNNGYRLVIKDDNVKVFYGKIGFSNPDENLMLDAYISSCDLKEEDFVVEIEGIDYVGEEDVFDIQVGGAHSFDANGFWVHNCGEVPLGEWGMCNLISVNLPAHLDKDNNINWGKLEETIRYSIRFADALIDKAYYPFEEFKTSAQRLRKIGLGLMGLADVFLFKQCRYGSDESVKMSSEIAKFFAKVAFDESVELAKKYGPAPAIEEYFGNDFEKMILSSKFLQKLTETFPDLGDKIKKYGLRNTNLLSIAPTGSISILAGVSSAFEPVFYLHMKRWSDSFKRMVEFEHPAYTELKRRGVIKDDEKPDWLVTAEEIDPKDKLKIHAALQEWVDLSISNTYVLSEKVTKDDVADFVMKAWKSGVKGVTIYRHGTRGAVISAAGEKKDEKDDERQEITLDDIDYRRGYSLNAVSYKFVDKNGKNIYINVAGERRAPLEVYLGSKSIYPQDFVIAFNTVLSMYLKDLYVLSEKYDKSFYKRKLSKIIDELMEIRSHDGAMFFLGHRIYSPVGFWAMALKYFRDGRTPEKELEIRSSMVMNINMNMQREEEHKVIDLYPGGLSNPPQDDAILTKCPNCGAYIWTKEHEFEFDCNYPCPNCGYSNKCD